MTTQDTLFTPERIAEQSKSNFAFLSLATLAYFKEKGLKVEEWLNYVGSIAAKTGWATLAEQGALTIITMVALNMVSMGAELVSISGDENRAEAVLKDFSTQEMLELLSLSQEEAKVLSQGWFSSIINGIGLKSTVSFEDGKYTLNVAH